MTKIYGIRHHGPGSARSLLAELRTDEPDLILIEGPPDADHLLPTVTAEGMEPPVAIVVYAATDATRAVFYPFAAFSPEWQAARFAVRRGIPVRFMDLPQTHALALEEDGEDDDRSDPLGLLARAAGHEDGEEWWGAMVEEGRDGAGLFEGILAAMTEVRAAVEKETGPSSAREFLREASMRKILRRAEREGFTRIAVVCGAWHAPVLVDRPLVREDNEALKGLPRVKVEATWVPWTYGRLARRSGYGAGVESPGWYDHLFHESDRLSERWLTKAARVLRNEGIDVSPAHVIESVRLADALAALRDRPRPGLAEMTECIRTVMLFGEDLPLALVDRDLLVSERLGRIPEEVPQVPLARDLERRRRTLRLTMSAVEKNLVLDLRKEIGLGRSHLFRRLRLLDIPWGVPLLTGGGKGTFKEGWLIRWEPEFAVRLIEASTYGQTIAAAAGARVVMRANGTDRIVEIADLLEEVLPADLPAGVDALVHRLDDLAAVAGDTTQLMRALPPLVRILRYGDVRGTDVSQVERILGGIVERTAVSLTLICSSLSDEAAAEIAGLIDGVHDAVLLLERTDWKEDWLDALVRVAEIEDAHGRIRGRVTRLLCDAGRIDAGETARRLSFALSPAEMPAVAAAWIEGFLGRSGGILIHDVTILGLLDKWVAALKAPVFLEMLPLLRRTFGTFEAPVRRSLGEILARGPVSARAVTETDDDIDIERADAVLPLLELILGLREEGP